jgi:hypothetical protein
MGWIQLDVGEGDCITKDKFKQFLDMMGYMNGTSSQGKD